MVHVDHVALSVLLAVCRGLAALRIERWFPHARVISTTPAADVHHTVVNMLVAFLRSLAALEINRRSPRAGTV